MVQIPTGLKAIYDDTINNLIDSEFGVSCIVSQPPAKYECPNCILNTSTNISSGRYKSGGPVSFTSGQTCPYCLGAGYKEVTVSSNFNMLVYWDAAQWAKDNKLKIYLPAGTLVTKGKMENYEAVFTCDSMTLHSGITNRGPFIYQKYGEPTPFGIGKDNFFVCFWTRI